MDFEYAAARNGLALRSALLGAVADVAKEYDVNAREVAMALGEIAWLLDAASKKQAHVPNEGGQS